MSQTDIFLPLFIMIALTFFTGFRMLKLRFYAVKNGDLSPQYFLLYRGAKVPDYLAKVEQHYLNLFEMPIAFYFLVVLLYITQQVSVIQLVLAWAFVVSRLIHSYIHTTHNQLLWRMRTFLFGIVVLMLAWLHFGWTLFINS